MEILHTSLNYISIYVESAVIAYMLYALSCIVTKTLETHKVKAGVVLSFIVFLVHVITNHFIYLTWLRSLITIVIFSLAAKYVYKIKLLPATLSTIITMIVFALFELFAIFIIKLIGYEPQIIKANDMYNVLIVLIMSLTCFVFTYFIFKIYTKKILNVNHENRLGKYIVPQCVAIIICLIPSMALLIKNEFDYSNTIIMINILQLCVVFIVSQF